MFKSTSQELSIKINVLTKSLFKKKPAKDFRKRKIGNTPNGESMNRDQIRRLQFFSIPGNRFFVQPSHISCKLAYILVRISRLPLATRRLYPLPFTSLASATSSTILSLIDSCPPTASYTSRRIRIDRK